jgi:hypothetical protein
LSVKVHIIWKTVNLGQNDCMKNVELRKRVHEIIDSCDDKIIEAVYTLLLVNNTENILGESEEKYNEEIVKAEAEIDNGSFVNHDDLKNQIKKW